MEKVTPVLATQDVQLAFDESLALDPMLPQRQMRAFAERLADPGHVAMVDVFREHMYQEMVVLDIDALMATMVDEPSLYFYGLPQPPDVGFDAVKDHYLKSFPSRAAGGVTMDIHRLVVDDDALYLDGLGIFSLEFTKEHFGVELQTDRPAVVAKHVAVVAPFIGGRIECEAQYFDGAVTASDVVYLDQGEM